jgi:hypothetical protein
LDGLNLQKFQKNGGGEMTLTHYISGAEIEGASGRVQDVFNPATGAVIDQVPLASTAEVDRVVAVAREALPGWAATPAAKRAQVMFNFRQLILDNVRELATLISSQHGKTIDDAMGEVARGVEVVEFACGISHALKGEFLATGGRRCRCVLDAPAGWCGCRDHAVQFSGNGADVDVPDGACHRQYLCPQTFRTRSGCADDAGAAAQTGWSSRWVFQHRPWRQGSG